MCFYLRSAELREEMKDGWTEPEGDGNLMWYISIMKMKEISELIFDNGELNTRVSEVDGRSE